MTTCDVSTPEPMRAAPVAVAPALRLIEPYVETLYVEPRWQPQLPWSRPDPEPDTAQAPLGIDAEVRATATRLAGAIVEVLRGRRPHLHLTPYLAETVLELVCDLAADGERHGLRVAGVQVGSPADDVAEAAIRLQHDGRSSAMALRLERTDRRWRVVVLEVAFDRQIRRAGRASGLDKLDQR